MDAIGGLDLGENAAEHSSSPGRAEGSASSRVVLTLRAFLHHLDQHHHSGTSVPTAEQLAQEVADTYELTYADRKSGATKQRGPSQVLAAVRDLLRDRSNEKRTTMKTLLGRGSTALCTGKLERVKLGDPLPPLRRSHRTLSAREDGEAAHRGKLPSAIAKLGHDRATVSPGEPTPSPMTNSGWPSIERKRRRNSLEDLRLPDSREHQTDLAAGRMTRKRGKEAMRDTGSNSRSQTGQVRAAWSSAPTEILGNSSAIQPSENSLIPFRNATDPIQLNNDDIRRRFQYMTVNLESIVHQELDSLAITGDKTVIFDLEPECRLRQVYTEMFGRSAPAARMAEAAQLLTPPQVAKSLCGAFLHCRVFTVPPLLNFDTWRGAIMSSLGEMAGDVEREMEVFSCSTEAMLRRAALQHVSRAQHEQAHAHTLSHHFVESAHRLGTELALSLHRHLTAGTAVPIEQQATLHLSERLAKVLKTALTLRCEISISQEHYIFLWPAAGETIDACRMESLNGAGEVVVTGFFTGLECVKTSGSEIVFKAPVLANDT